MSKMAQKMQFFIYDEEERMVCGMSAEIYLEKTKDGCVWLVSSPDTDITGTADDKIAACLDFLKKRLV